MILQDVTLSSLNHGNVAKLHHYWMTNYSHFICMSLLQESPRGASSLFHFDVDSTTDNVYWLKLTWAQRIKLLLTLLKG